MATVNGDVHTKRNAAPNRARSERSASDRLGRKAREVTKDLQEMGEIAKDAVQEKFGFEQYIRERPLKSILIAAGVGMLLGRFWRRR